jgi:predicted amidohydrolase
VKREHTQPRKVVVATSMFGPYGRWPGLAARLGELGDLIDRMAEEAGALHPGRRMDLAVLPEDAVCGGRPGTAAERSVPLEGPVLQSMGTKAREHGTYVVVPLFMAEPGRRGAYSNAAVLVDRTGAVAGIYRKVHPVLVPPDNTLEGGVEPGVDYPVVHTDFGTVGAQVCFDINFPEGWETLGAGGADIVVWPTQSPGLVRPSAYALQWRYHVLSATWRNNASLFDPMGLVLAQIREPRIVLACEIDLSFVVLPWSGQLRNGAYLAERYGDRIGYRYSEAEDAGIFWSNDPAIPVGEMVREAGLETVDELLARNRASQDLARREPPRP